MAVTQQEREVAVKTPLGEDKLLLRSMVGTEVLGRPFEYNLELLSEDPDIKLEDLLGQGVTVRLDLPDDQQRHFNGICTHFSFVGGFGEFAHYRATMRPWIWLLSRTSSVATRAPSSADRSMSRDSSSPPMPRRR